MGKWLDSLNTQDQTKVQKVHKPAMERMQAPSATSEPSVQANDDSVCEALVERAAVIECEAGLERVAAESKTAAMHEASRAKREVSPGEYADTAVDYRLYIEKWRPKHDEEYPKAPPALVGPLAEEFWKLWWNALAKQKHTKEDGECPF